MASRRPGPLHTIPVATRSASDWIARCMICFEPCPRKRSPSGHSTSRSSCRRITIPGFRPTSFCSARNRSYQLTTCLGAQPRPRLDPPTGYDSIGCACRLHTPGHWSISKKLQRRDESRRTRKLPITLVTWFTWETVWSKIGGVLNWTSWPHIHVYGVKPFSGSRDDLLPARAPLPAAAEEPPTQETPAQANPQYPDWGEFWLGRPVTVGLLPATPIPAAPISAVLFPVGPVPAAPIPATDAPPVRAKPALKRSTCVNKGVNPNAANVPRRAVWRPYCCVALLCIFISSWSNFDGLDRSSGITSYHYICSFE